MAFWTQDKTNLAPSRSRFSRGRWGGHDCVGRAPATPRVCGFAGDGSAILDLPGHPQGAAGPQHPTIQSPGYRLDTVFFSCRLPTSGHAGGKILGVLALFLVMVWYSIYREDRYIQL